MQVWFLLNSSRGATTMTVKFLSTSAGVFLMLASTATSARAQAAPWLGSSAAYSRDDDRVSYVDARRAAYDNGYRDGLRQGEQAARDRRQLDAERERDYRKAENGYNRSYGDKNRYRDNYRSGFAQGYRDGFGRNDIRQSGNWDGGAGYGRDRGYRDSATYRDNSGPAYRGTAGYGGYQNGIADGYRKGLDDLHDRKSPDVRRQKWYRSGDHGYDSDYGSKDAYRVEYRRGFEEGYRRAYNERRY
jgi:flagellar biosynthesis/type III secretory pathway protein FliH